MGTRLLWKDGAGFEPQSRARSVCHFMNSQPMLLSWQWQVTTLDDSDILRLNWTENGGPSVVQRTRRGFGSALIERGLSLELNGKVNMEFDPSGLNCAMLLPLTAIEER